jgi:diguanylate cyclase (GGDEF)-like protein
VRRLPKLTQLALFAIAFPALHFLALQVFTSQAALASYPFMLLAPSLACAACVRRASQEERAARSPWILLAAGLVLWVCGMVLSVWEEVFQHLPPSIAWFSDFAFFLYAVPVLLAISSVTTRQRILFFVWMDAAQALMTGFLAYVAIFSVLPFSNTTLAPISGTMLVLTYNAENCVLAVAATLRLCAQPRGNERRFYAMLCSFLWMYGIAAYLYNNWAVQSNDHTALDIIVDVPFLFLAAASVAQGWLRRGVEEAPEKRTLALFIENVSPIFYTVALLALSISLIHEHFYVGTAGVFTALGVYATRATTLQGRYIRVQRELHDARDRLEQMALTDALTNTANRRRFDTALEQEWSRAQRNRHPLALLLIDIDYFKLLNDRYGHPAGDRCLVSVALALQSALPRAGDLLARYGGEEFAAILPATDESGARLVATAMQTAIQSLTIRNESSTGLYVTVSVGVAVFESAQAETADIVEAADQALYRAKQRGRNRIESTVQGDFLRNGTQ